jgi:GTP-binding protein
MKYVSRYPFPVTRKTVQRLRRETGNGKRAIENGNRCLNTEEHSKTRVKPPVVAIVGRPNVGKSRLFNRLIGRRRAIVGDEPGITRDRLYGEMEWRGRSLRIVDTGGIIPDDKELIPAAIFTQAKVALAEAAAIVLVVDARSELAAPDLELARLLCRAGKPLFLAVNKIDTPKLDASAAEFYRLGISRLYPISAEHGTGVAELLDALVEILPAAPEGSAAVHDGGLQAPAADAELQPYPDEPGEVPSQEQEVKVAIIGRPNVGKSTLLNALTGTERALVSPIPGTTRDAVDEVVERNGTRFRFIDTAGIRRKGKTKLMAEKLSVVMARKHLEAADIALLIIDASEGVTALDANIAGYAHESGRSVIVVINKWDLVGAKSGRESLPRAERGGGPPIKTGRKSEPAVKAGRKGESPTTDRNRYERQVRDSLKFLNYAPVVFVSALRDGSPAKIFPQLELVARERRKRVSTGEMNRLLKTIDFDRAPVPLSRRVRIYYLTQAGTSPPTFILFTDRKVKLHFAYERFLENQIRRAFGFVGTPIRIKVRESK